jgi:type II secretory pathway pseudopilin PulG
MTDVDRDLQFGRVLESGSSHKRGLLLILPVVVVFAIIVGFAVVAISRMSGLSTEVKVAQQQAQEAQKAADERDQKLREARAETAILGSAGQGASVLAAAAQDSGASGVAIVHPETNSLSVYAYNLMPPPDGKEYRIISRNGQGNEKDVAALTPDDRGGAFVLARDVPEGASHVEIALVPKGGAAPQGQGANAQPGAAQQQATRQTVLAGDLPRPGEAGVVAAPQPDEGAKAAKPQAQARRGGRR